MSKKMTRKSIYEAYGRANVYCVPYCELQNLLRYKERIGYSTRAEGWACDYYDLGKGVVISTGYAPVGKHVEYDVLRQFDDAALKVWCEEASPDKASERIDDLIVDFILTIKGRRA